MARKYIRIEDREAGKRYNQDQFGCWEFTAAENAAADAADAAHQANLPKQKTLAKIRALEVMGDDPRRRREALLTEEGKAWLQDIDSQIVAERQKLKDM